MNEQAPFDPFEGDPADPAGILDDFDDDSAPLTLDERAELIEEVEDVELFQAVLEPRGIRGLVVDCDDCDEAHYYAWDLLRANLRRLIDVGKLGMHEPAFEPDPDEYVSWDYARGFTDAMLAEAETGRPGS
ncbi:MAG: DUF5319 family protein [Mycobacteriales bacterium]